MHAAVKFFVDRSRARKVEAGCRRCSVRGLCLGNGVSARELEEVQYVVSARRRLKRGEAAYRAGDPFGSLYAIRRGSFKTSALHHDGREQVTAFPMAAELLGVDAIAAGRHIGTAIALEDSEVCVMPYALIERMGREYLALRRHVSAELSREIGRARDMMVLLGRMRADERLAAFLSNLSAHHGQRGHSRVEFHLRMSRLDIGSFLGVTLETVCRMFRQFKTAGLINVKGRRVSILDRVALERIAGPRA